MPLLNIKRREKYKYMSWYGPFVGAGIKVTNISEDLTFFRAEMNLNWYNKNIVGTHFGGSLYAMCDPFFMLILLENLGKDFIVWDKSALIRFRKPGRMKVYADFSISRERIEEIKSEVQDAGKMEYTFTAEVKDMNGLLIAEVEKLVYVKRKDYSPDQKQG